MTTRFLFLSCTVFLLGSQGGCSPTIRMPQLLHPGPAGYQLQNAEKFDPYPIVDMGPEIEGGRPIDFVQPRSEVEQARTQLPVGPWRMGPRY